ncbi:protein IQ-DOMAIN 14-like [Andrographis paniculata]|uniref:protein IQ-DOMAIN 14-like n=1 Tax=Andrographis paniculata TaxID=175694 RepID=UPI0021E8177E|nr:protein IQ-DOMAIN 14-like [Andrographis paniculata]
MLALVLSFFVHFNFYRSLRHFLFRVSHGCLRFDEFSTQEYIFKISKCVVFIHIEKIMGKKGGSWFSAIKRVFTKDRESNGSSDDKFYSSKERKKGKGILSHGEARSFIPLFREPSSVEKILGEADHLLIKPPTTTYFHQSKNANFLKADKVSSSRIDSFPSISAPRGGTSSWLNKVTQRQREANHLQMFDPIVRNRKALAAIKIQAALRGYLARRNFRALRGLVRLQGVVRSENVKQQTMNAMKQMQLLVRIQTQIRSRRMSAIESQTLYRCNDTVESEATSARNGEWDDSMLTKQEIEARRRKKVEGVAKRERAMAYQYSHKLWRTNAISGVNPLDDDVRSNGFPWWWSWSEPRPPPTSTSQAKIAASTTSPMLIPHNRPKSQPNNRGNRDSTVSPSPMSTTIVDGGKQYRTPPPDDTPMRDDDSLTSCPAFSVPNYMSPTVSAKAKAKSRATSNPKERLPVGTPLNDSKRRFSLPLVSNIGSIKWTSKAPLKKGGAEASSEMKAAAATAAKHRRSIGDFSVDSAISMPAAVGRKPFNRFV